MDTAVRQEAPKAAVNGFEAGLVSVVTPVYNGGKYLPRLLDSILAQSWDKIEMILCDDGSDDGTLDIARSYEQKFRARGFSYKILSGVHKNASAAINLGLPGVRGEFLVWPDSDDRLEPDSVKIRAEFLLENPDRHCVRSLSRYEDENGAPVPRDERTGDIEEELLFFPILEGKTFVSCGCYMLRSQSFFDIYRERKIPEYNVGQNFQMLLPFVYRHPCRTIAKELYVVLVHEDSHSRRVLTEAQERKKYAEYEDMIDELAVIAGITDKKELKRIRMWKLRRRAALSRRHKRFFGLLAACFSIFCCLGPIEFFKEVLRRLR